MASNSLKCRFCEYNAPRYVTLKNGHKRDGYERLRAHVDREHPEQERLIERMEDLGSVLDIALYNEEQRQGWTVDFP